MNILPWKIRYQSNLKKKKYLVSVEKLSQKICCYLWNKLRYTFCTDATFWQIRIFGWVSIVEVDRILITTGMFCARATHVSILGSSIIDFLSILFYTVCSIQDSIKGCMVEMKQLCPTFTVVVITLSLSCSLKNLYKLRFLRVPSTHLGL